MIADSIAEVGIIEPPVVFPDRRQPCTYLLLDGHLRVILSRYGDSGKSRRGLDQAGPSTRGGPGILATRAADNERNTAWTRELFAAVQPLVFPGGIRELTRRLVNRVDVSDLLARWHSRRRIGDESGSTGRLLLSR